MGKIKQGILGGFNGTTGSVVGASWKGIAYMRGKAQSIKNPRTESQQANRSLFGFASDFFGRLLVVISLGFQAKAAKMSPFNLAVKKNLLEANFRAISGGYELLANKLMLSDGEPMVTRDGAPSVSGDAVSARITITPPEGKAGKVLFVLMSTDGKTIAYSQTGFQANATSASVSCDLPQAFGGDSLDCCAFLYIDETKEASATAFLGTVSL